MDQKTAQEVKQFLRSISSTINIEKAILFGSRARGDHLKDSDVDLILVSSDFTGTDWTERGKDLYTHWDGDHPLELLCYTPDEFRKKREQIGTVRTAVREGTEIEA